jgi:hypothetical protein
MSEHSQEIFKIAAGIILAVIPLALVYLGMSIAGSSDKFDPVGRLAAMFFWVPGLILTALILAQAFWHII